MDTSISRVTRPKSAARASYDKMSRWYDLIASSEAKFRDAGLVKLNAQPGERILTLGFGTGHGIEAIAQAVGDGGIATGVDMSPGMFEITEKRIADAGLSHRTELHCGDAAAVEFPPASFDGIFMSFILELFDTPEIPKVLARARGFLKDNGRLVLVTLSKENAGKIVGMYEWGHNKFPNFFDCRPIFIRPLLADADFAVVETTRMTMWGLPVDITVAHKENPEESD